MSDIGAVDFKSSRHSMISVYSFMFAILPLESVLPRRCLLPNQVSPQGSLYCSPPPLPLGDLGLDAAKLDYAQLRKVIQEWKCRGPPCPDFELHDNFHHPPNNINIQ